MSGRDARDPDERSGEASELADEVGGLGERRRHNFYVHIVGIAVEDRALVRVGIDPLGRDADIVADRRLADLNPAPRRPRLRLDA